jgi:predicted CopG family antitoxin
MWRAREAVDIAEGCEQREVMKSITISIDDEVYRAASEEAARRRKSLSELAQEFIERIGRMGATSGQFESDEAGKARREMKRFFAELNSQPRQEGASVGPLNREELYQRGAEPESESPAPETAEDENFRKRREDLSRFFAGLKAMHAGARGKNEVKRAALLERLHSLAERALERDRLKQGAFVPLTREEIYAERLDRFR